MSLRWLVSMTMACTAGSRVRAADCQDCAGRKQSGCEPGIKRLEASSRALTMPEARKAVAPPGSKCAQGERADMPQVWLTVAEEVRPLAIPLRTTFWRGGRKCAFDVHRNRRWLNRT